MEKNASLENGGVTTDMEESSTPNERCGVGRWRPSFLQSCGNIRMLTLVLTLSGMFRSLKDFYITSVLSTVERQFGFPSSLTGIIKNADNIGFMALVMIVNHVFRNSNKPRVFTVSILLTSLGLLMLTIPHFYYGVPKIDLQANVSTNSRHERNTSPSSVCDPNINGVSGQSSDGAGCGKTDTFGSFNAGAFAIFIAAQLIIGMASTPMAALSLTFIDDNVSKKNSPAYLGVMFGAGRALCPLAGFLLGAWTTSIYVDLTPQSIGRRDPRWIGAWWLGFLIIAVLSGIWALPMICFPKGLNKKAVTNTQMENVTENLKDFPRAAWRIVRNPVYPFLITGICCSILLVGYSTFLPKYMETEFGFPASTVNILMGAVLTVSSLFGPILSGCFMSKFQLNITTSLKLASIALFVCAGLQTSLIAFGCKQASWFGEMENDAETRMQLERSCNSNCSCSETLFQPVCGDSVNYISPCVAGCTKVLVANASSLRTKIYGDCSCVPSGRAVSGVCKASCPMAYAYVSVYALSMFINMFVIIPVFTSIMRCVSKKDKAFAVAGSLAPFSLVAFLGPILFGSVIDTTCQVRADNCGGPGACLLYDRWGLRFRLHVLAAGVKIVSFFFYVLGWLGSKRLKPEEDTEAEPDEKDKNPPENGKTIVPLTKYKNGHIESGEEIKPMLNAEEKM